MYELLFPNISETTVRILTLVESLISLAFAILFIIASWKLLEKFGEKPWKALIPFYNVYLIYKYTWKKGAFWVYLIATLAGDILFYASEVIAGKTPDNIWASILVLLAFPFLIVELAHHVLASIRITEAFGKKKSFAVGLVLLYEIFIMILGFGKSQYVYGKTDAEELPEESPVSEKM